MMEYPAAGIDKTSFQMSMNILGFTLFGREINSRQSWISTVNNWFWMMKMAMMIITVKPNLIMFSLSLNPTSSILANNHSQILIVNLLSGELLKDFKALTISIILTNGVMANHKFIPMDTPKILTATLNSGATGMASLEEWVDFRVLIDFKSQQWADHKCQFQASFPNKRNRKSRRK